MTQPFLQDSLINTLCAYIREINLVDGLDLKYSSSCHHANSNDSEDDSTPQRKPYGKLKHSKGTSSLKQTSKQLHSINNNFWDALASLNTPDDVLPVDIRQLQMYTAGTCNVTTNPSKITDNMTCDVCHEKHSFNKCPILLDTSYLKKHFVAYCSLWNRTQKQINLAAKRIQTTAVDSDNDDTVLDNSDTTNNNPDFYHEGE